MITLATIMVRSIVGRSTVIRIAVHIVFASLFILFTRTTAIRVQLPICVAVAGGNGQFKRVRRRAARCWRIRREAGRGRLMMEGEFDEFNFLRLHSLNELSIAFFKCK